MNEPRARQARFNVQSQDQWAGFGDHRRRVSDLLAEGRGRLCVLGVGNANDLDLVGLAANHREVHLVDLDAQALARGVERQGVAGLASIHRHGPLDLTGMIDVMANWSPLGPITDADLEALVEWPASRVGMALPGPFDRVASTCVLSQIIGGAAHALGPDHPRLPEVVRAIRRGHLRLLSRLTRPGGRVVLITDVVSTDHCPEVLDTPDPALPDLVARLSRAGGLILGVNPAEIRGAIRHDPSLATSLRRVEMTPPWRWRLHQRTYLVVAITASVASV